RPQHGALAEIGPALLAQGQDGADEVLAAAHSAGHTVHGDTHGLAGHDVPFVRGPRAAHSPPVPRRPADHLTTGADVGRSTWQQGLSGRGASCRLAAPGTRAPRARLVRGGEQRGGWPYRLVAAGARGARRPGGGGG